MTVAHGLPCAEGCGPGPGRDILHFRVVQELGGPVQQQLHACGYGGRTEDPDQLAKSAHEIREMGEREIHHRIIRPVQEPVEIAVESIGGGREGIQLVIVELVHHQDGAVGDAGGPLVQPFQDRADTVLRTPYPRHLAEGLPEKAHQPLPPVQGPGEVQPVEYGEFLLRMENGKVKVCVLVKLHANG